jgi:hypothetical protein
MLADAVGVALIPFDWARRYLLDGLVPRRLITDREARVAVTGIGTALFALALAWYWPLIALGIGPLVLGVPHLLADIRYLVVRPRLHHRRSLLLAVGLPLVLVGIWPAVSLGMVVPLGALAVANAPRNRRLVAAVAAFVVLASGLQWPNATVLLVIHLHNAVAVWLWWHWRRRRGEAGAWSVVAAVGIAASVLVLASWFGHEREAWPLPGLTWASLGDELAPFADPKWLHLGVRLFAFGQAVHYGLWLRLIPDEDRARPTPRSFQASWRALVSEFGAVPLALVACTTLALMTWGWFNAASARDGYLHLAGWHAYLEFAVIALAWAEARRISKESYA